MAWAIVVLSLALVASILWISYKKPSEENNKSIEKKVGKEFDDEKNKEHKRIESFNNQQLVDDLNSRLRK